MLSNEPDFESRKKNQLDGFKRVMFYLTLSDKPPEVKQSKW